MTTWLSDLTSTLKWASTAGLLADLWLVMAVMVERLRRAAIYTDLGLPYPTPRVRLPTTLHGAIRWFTLAMLILLGLMLLMGFAYAQSADPCDTTLANANIIQNRTRAIIAKAERAPRRSSAVRLAVLDAKNASGFYQATRMLLPLACHGDHLTTFDMQLSAEIASMNAWVAKHW